MLSFFPLDVLEEIWDVTESVAEGYLTYSFINDKATRCLKINRKWCPQCTPVLIDWNRDAMISRQTDKLHDITPASCDKDKQVLNSEVLQQTF